jgi:hypothetical protein
MGPSQGDGEGDEAEQSYKLAFRVPSFRCLEALGGTSSARPISAILARSTVFSRRLARQTVAWVRASNGLNEPPSKGLLPVEPN